MYKFILGVFVYTGCVCMYVCVCNVNNNRVVIVLTTWIKELN